MAADVSVVISTYNRCSLLARALESLRHQESVDVCYEVLVVDNNSTDETREITQRVIGEDPEKFRYIFEPKQGVSYGRNAGIASAHAEIIAFTDDDVRVSSSWVSRIKAGFAAEPSADFLGGKVLPHWSGIPPAWLEGHLSRWAYSAPTFSGLRTAWARWRITNCCCGSGGLAAKESICPI